MDFRSETIWQIKKRGNNLRQISKESFLVVYVFTNINTKHFRFQEQKFNKSKENWTNLKINGATRPRVFLKLFAQELRDEF